MTLFHHLYTSIETPYSSQLLQSPNKHYSHPKTHISPHAVKQCPKRAQPRPPPLVLLACLQTRCRFSKLTHFAIDQSYYTYRPSIPIPFQQQQVFFRAVCLFNVPIVCMLFFTYTTVLPMHPVRSTVRIKATVKRIF